jgi:hypothetical protein
MRSSTLHRGETVGQAQGYFILTSPARLIGTPYAIPNDRLSGARHVERGWSLHALEPLHTTQYRYSNSVHAMNDVSCATTLA